MIKKFKMTISCKLFIKLICSPHRPYAPRYYTMTKFQFPRYELLHEGRERALGTLGQDPDTFPLREPYQTVDRCKKFTLIYD